MKKLNEYTVTLRSTPGFYEQYSGDVTVYAANDEQAIERALKKLKQTFPDRSNSMWRVKSVTRNMLS